MNNKYENEVQEEETHNEEEEIVSDHVLVGGIDECNPQLYTFLKNILSELRSQNLINIPEIFNENIDRCFHQLVNGNIF